MLQHQSVAQDATKRNEHPETLNCGKGTNTSCEQLSWSHWKSIAQCQHFCNLQACLPHFSSRDCRCWTLRTACSKGRQRHCGTQTLGNSKRWTHTHVIISDNTFPVKRRLRVNKTPNNSNTCELPTYFCTTCKQSAKIGLCLEVPLWKAHVKAKRSLPRLTASNSAFKNAHSTLHSVLQLSQGQLFLNRADQQYSMCCWIAKCPLQILSGKQLYVGGSWGIQLFRV